MSRPDAPDDPETRRPITDLLLDLGAGRPDAMDRLFPLVYEELHRIAHRVGSTERTDYTLGTTGLVHETYLRLVDQRRVGIQDRTHFFALAARAMRHVLVDYARRRQALKRGGNEAALSLDEAIVAIDQRADTLCALDEALTRLAALDSRLAKVVECRFFGGLSEEETADVVGVTPRTVRRDWTKAKGWLYRELTA
jgi:RNA polymerase sigma factor (TIGR02999 family)